MKGMVCFQRNGVKVCVTHLPKRKKPCIAVEIDNYLYKVASFDSEEMADWFLDIVDEMFGKAEVEE